MKDRVPKYPGRVKLTPVAGQDGVFDMVRADEPTQEGTPLNKGTLLSDETAEILGLTGEATVDEGLGRIARSLAWVLISSYKSAGAYTWTAPDIYGDGQPYQVGVLVIGGGGSGAAVGVYNSKDRLYAPGGASGYSEFFVKEVIPGSVHSIVVGAGGNAVVGTANNATLNKYGENGGASSFAGIVAEGGQGAQAGDTHISQSGGQPARETFGAAGFGGKIVDGFNTIANRDIFSCFNPFTGEKILGAGGGVYVSINSAGEQDATVALGGKDPATGKGGGNGQLTVASGTAQSADDIGCGGGSAGCRKINGTVTLTSGRGGDGAVLIYARR